jgi:hypothetical protein
VTDHQAKTPARAETSHVMNHMKGACLSFDALLQVCRLDAELFVFDLGPPFFLEQRWA